MVDRFCTQGWNFTSKDGTRRVVAWKSRSQRADRRLPFLSIQCVLFAAHLAALCSNELREPAAGTLPVLVMPACLEKLGNSSLSQKGNMSHPQFF
jgi:hypothetical protein